MAQDFNIIDFTRDEEKLNLYYAKIRFEGVVERYEIRCNIGTKLRYNSPLMITVDDCIPEENDDLQIRVRGVSNKSRELERELNSAIYDFAWHQD